MHAAGIWYAIVTNLILIIFKAASMSDSKACQKSYG
jgi:hypothetical protein